MARDGNYYTLNNIYSPPHTAWIWHKPPYRKVPSDDGWIEVIHRKDPFGDERALQPLKPSSPSFAATNANMSHCYLLLQTLVPGS